MTLVKINKQDTKYDMSHDVLHVFFPPFDYSFDDEEYPGIIIKRSTKDDRVTGLIILEFSKRSRKELLSKLPRYDFSEVAKLQ